MIILGGASSVLSDYTMARQLAGMFHIIAVNDMIAEFHDRIQCAASLHVDKLRGWLNQRAYRKLNAPTQVWSTQRNEVVTHVTEDWYGSSGLFAIRVAVELGYQKIILCGVPMQTDANHILRKIPWRDCDRFQSVWKYRQRQMGDRVRSMSGYTRDLLGAPTREWLCS